MAHARLELAIFSVTGKRVNLCSNEPDITVLYHFCTNEKVINNVIAKLESN